MARTVSQGRALCLQSTSGAVSTETQPRTTACSRGDTSLTPPDPRMPHSSMTSPRPEFLEAPAAIKEPATPSPGFSGPGIDNHIGQMGRELLLTVAQTMTRSSQFTMGFVIDTTGIPGPSARTPHNNLNFTAAVFRIPITQKAMPFLID